MGLRELGKRITSVYNQQKANLNALHAKRVAEAEAKARKVEIASTSDE